jgi:hypothetical protein
VDRIVLVDRLSVVTLPAFTNRPIVTPIDEHREVDEGVIALVLMAFVGGQRKMSIVAI